MKFVHLKNKLIILLLSLYPGTILAANCEPPKNANDPWPNCVKQNSDFLAMLGKVIDMFLILAGTVAVLFIIIGGFQYVASAGNPDSVFKAKNTVLYAVIGLIVVILSYAVVKFIVGRFQ